MFSRKLYKNMSGSLWQEPSQEIFLAEDEAHIWLIALIQKEECLEFLADLLNENEKAKAAGFRFEIDKRSYAAAHGAMREILGFYLECYPQKIKFGQNCYGKPFLSENKTTIRFNLSHSHEWALLAVTKGKRIGVDIERIRAEIIEENLAEQIFSAVENEILWSLPKEFQVKAFFDCWTRKEAFIKAVGHGLSYPLKEFSVSLAPDQTPKLLSVKNFGDKAENWQIEELNVAANYAAAVVIESKHTNLKLYHWKCLKNF